jgi:hypothetical protein
MITSVSEAGTSTIDIPAHTDTAAVTSPPGPRHVAAALPAAGGDPLARLAELLGQPHHAQYTAKSGTKGATTTTRSSLSGVELPGQKGVAIQRELGDPKGYESKNHALAWARAAGSDTAMVVQGKDKRWHAVETNKAANDVSGGAGKVVSAIQVGKVDQATYDSLKAQAMKNNDPAKWKTFAAYALGLPESEINVVRKGETPSHVHVNINLSPDFNAEGKTSGFDPKNPPWVQLGPAAFDRPANAVATLAHEEVHADHHRMTSRLFGEYTAQAKKPTNEGFRAWAYEKHGVRTADIVGGYQDGKANAATELEAHVEAARVAFSSGDLVQARTDLNKVATLPNLPLLQTQMHSIKALEKLRDSLSGDALRVFNEVVQTAKKSPVLKGL